MTRIIRRERAKLWVSGFFFKSVVQTVLIFGSDTWVVTPHIGRVLGRLHDWVERRPDGAAPAEEN